MSSPLYERLIKICEDQGAEQPTGRDIERATGLTSGRISQIKHSQAAKLNQDTIARLSRLGYAAAWVASGAPPMKSEAPCDARALLITAAVESILTSHGLSPSSALGMSAAEMSYRINAAISTSGPARRGIDEMVDTISAEKEKVTQRTA